MRMLPINCVWDSENAVLVPEPRYVPLCRRQFENGEGYPLEVVEHRNMNSHRQYFAALHEGYLNLAEEHAARFPTEEHLRHWALIQCGFCTERDEVCDSPAAAKAYARGVRFADVYAVIKISGNVVKIFRAESQDTHSMKKARFEESKRAVLDLVASMARTTRGQLNQNAGKSA